MKWGSLTSKNISLRIEYLLLLSHRGIHIKREYLKFVRHSHLGFILIILLDEVEVVLWILIDVF